MQRVASLMGRSCGPLTGKSFVQCSPRLLTTTAYVGVRVAGCKQVGKNVRDAGKRRARQAGWQHAPPRQSLGIAPALDSQSKLPGSTGRSSNWSISCAWPCPACCALVCCAGCWALAACPWAGAIRAYDRAGQGFVCLSASSTCRTVWVAHQVAGNLGLGCLCTLRGAHASQPSLTLSASSMARDVSTTVTRCTPATPPASWSSTCTAACGKQEGAWLLRAVVVQSPVARAGEPLPRSPPTHTHLRPQPPARWGNGAPARHAAGPAACWSRRPAAHRRGTPRWWRRWCRRRRGCSWRLARAHVPPRGAPAASNTPHGPCGGP